LASDCAFKDIEAITKKNKIMSCFFIWIWFCLKNSQKFFMKMIFVRC
jgi:hypothetical protein